MTIGQVAQRAGIRVSAVRYYEAEGLLPAPPRIGGKRQYAPSVLETLAVIELAKDAGFALKEIRAAFSMPEEPSVVWKRLAGRKRVELDRQLSELARRRRVLRRLSRCECASFDECGSIVAKKLAQNKTQPR
jgi:MerR family redox-sensitive transcriptional activator SoxR